MKMADRLISCIPKVCIVPYGGVNCWGKKICAENGEQKKVTKLDGSTSEG